MPGEYSDDIREAMAEVESRSSGDAGVIDVEARELPDAGGESGSTAGQDARDTSGRFAPRTPAQPAAETPPQGKEKPPGEVQQTTEGATPPTDKNQGQPTPAVALRPPTSWTPEAREEWASLSPRIQQEVLRRDREITDAMRVNAESRRFYTDVSQTIQPYMHMIQAENSTPVAAIANLFQTAAALRTGTPQNKAALVAHLIEQYSVDVNALDEAIVARRSGQPPPQAQPAAQQPLHDPRLDAIIQERQAAQAQEMQTLQTETETFMNDPANEFAYDLREDMADILELASRRNRKISLHDAYQTAILQHPTISGIVQTRKAAAGGQKETEAARRARNAAASLSSDGAPGRESGEGPDDLRSVIATAMRESRTSR